MTTGASRNAVWQGALLGFLAGAAAVAIGAITFVALIVLAAAPLFLLVAMGFGGMPKVLLVLGVALCGALAAPWILAWVLRRFVRGLRELDRLPVAAGAAFGIAVAVALTPDFVKDEVSSLVMGESKEARASLPTADAERQRLSERVRPAAIAGDPAAQVELALALQYGAAGEARDLDASAAWIKQAALHSHGFEARLMIAVTRWAEPVPRGGRVVTAQDTGMQVAALRRLAPELPPDWQPLLLGTIGKHQETHYGGTHPDDQPMRDTLVDAGRAGSRALTVLAAAFDEAVATSDEKRDRSEQAEAGWRRAQQGYAAAGAVFEVERLRVETLPERLAAFPDPPPAAVWPAPDAMSAQRFWRFAWALDGDEVHVRAPPSYRELAATAALLAMERSPDPASMASRSPADRWSKDPWALGRYLLALRHARGDCSAALDLSNAIRHRRKTGFSGITPKVSMHDMTWALAWAEVGERCADTDEVRQHAAERRGALVAMYIDARELERARAGVAATIAALR